MSSYPHALTYSRCASLCTHTFIFANMASGTVSQTHLINLTLSFSAKKLQTVCLRIRSNNPICPSVLMLQTCTGAFCKGTPFTLFTRHQFTVAGNYERLFLFIFVFCFPTTKLLHEVCLKTNSVLSGIWWEQLYNQTGSFLGHPRVRSWPTQLWDDTSRQTWNCFFQNKSIFDCINYYMLAQVHTKLYQVQETRGSNFNN